MHILLSKYNHSPYYTRQEAYAPYLSLDYNVFPQMSSYLYMNYMSDKSSSKCNTVIRCEVIYEVRSVKSHRENLASHNIL